jgi:hypothetical protein
MSERTLVVSATNLMARGFLVVPTDRRARDGAPVNGLFAAARGVMRALGFKLPTRAVAVIEAGGPGATWPELLAGQHAALPELMTALGLTVVAAEGEVHAVASYAQAELDRGDDVVIAGVDKRYAQLVSDRLWWYDANKDARYTPEIVGARGRGDVIVREQTPSAASATRAARGAGNARLGSSFVTTSGKSSCSRLFGQRSITSLCNTKCR